MANRKALERWGGKILNGDVTLQVMWPAAKSLMKKDGSKATTAIRGPLGIKYQATILRTVWSQFTYHNLCDENKGTVIGSQSPYPTLG
jgi:hypothetical protein